MEMSWVLCLILLVVLLFNMGMQFRGWRKRQAEETLRKQKEFEQTNLIQNYEKLVSLELLKSVYKEKNSKVFGMKPVRIENVILDVNTDDFLSIIRTMKTEQMFRFINEFMKESIPVIYKNHGQIDKFSNGGFMAFFEESCENGLTAAISICEQFEKHSKQGRYYDKFSIGLCYGTVYAGVVGNERRYSLLTISEYTGLAVFLRSIARKYYARILVTESYLLRIPDFDKRFHARFIGYVYLSKRDTLEKIYDVFDGDSVLIRNEKRKTKIVFEKGVSYYVNGEYQKAREYFIEVLKSDNKDKAAKEYLYRCEEYLGADNPINKPAYMECY